jgi:hypothetical protein
MPTSIEITKSNGVDATTINGGEQEIQSEIYVKKQAKKSESDEIPLSFASFYYSLKVSRGKGDLFLFPFIRSNLKKVFFTTIKQHLFIQTYD